MSRKYEFTDDTIEVDGHTLYRIIALINFYGVEAGDLGGYIESEKNLSHDCESWIYRSARVFEQAHVDGYAHIYGYARIYGSAVVTGRARVYGYAQIYGNASLTKDVRVGGNIKLDHGIWSNRIEKDSNQYLISTTLEKISIPDKVKHIKI